MLNSPVAPWPCFSQEEADRVREVLLSNRVNYWTGQETRSFETEFARWTQSRHAIALTNGIQGYQGRGHSCGIYSKSDANIMKLAENTYTSRVMVNQPQAASNSGNLWNGMRQTFSLGCGSWGGNATNNNISWRDLINETWVSKPLKQTKVIPSDEELFGKDIIETVGRELVS